MTREPISRLPGMRDLSGREAERMGKACETLSRFLAAHHYEPISTPVLEDTELFVRKSGGELVSRLYTFTDPGGRAVSLRPEFTSSVIRHVVANRGGKPGASRWQYCGPVFRYDHGENGGYRQFTQAGAEMVGDGSVEADAETVWLAWSGLRELGLKGCRVRLGHLGMLQDLISQCGLSDSANAFAVTNLHELKSGQTDITTLLKRAEEVGLLRSAANSVTLPEVRGVDDATVQGFILEMLKEGMSGPTGRRSPEQIVSRLMRKTREADDPQKLEQAVGLIYDLARMDGPANTVLPEVRRLIAERGLSAARLEELDAVLEALVDHGVADSELTLDFGLARGIAYYTGIVFELVPTQARDSTALGGGGRYDELVKALGAAEDVPALGFAYNMDSVLQAMDVGAVSRPRESIKSRAGGRSGAATGGS